MLSQIKESVDYIKNRVGDFNPEIGIILGTGLGGLVSEIEIEHQLMYSNIPNFPISTLEFHSGKLIFGTLSGKKVVAMQGRLHFYEGYNMKQITFPVRVLKLLGIQKLFVSNASGSLNPTYKLSFFKSLNLFKSKNASLYKFKISFLLPILFFKELGRKLNAVSTNKPSAVQNR